MFHPMDLVAPLGIALLAVALCTWGFIKAKNTPARIACALTAAAFCGCTAGLYVMRHLSRKADYTTMQGVRVRQGIKNKCEKSWVTSEVQWVLDWWAKQCPDKGMTAVAAAVDDRLLVCVDEERLSAAGRWVRGYTWGSVAVVGWNGNPAYTSSLIRHELSHTAAVGCGYPLDEEKHHALFKSLKLGH